MRSYEVLVYSGRPVPPEFHLVTVADDEAASHFADQLLFESFAAVGVAVTYSGQRLYVRGTVPVSAGAALHARTGRVCRRPQRGGANL
jgi:hypothetical protein